MCLIIAREKQGDPEIPESSIENAWNSGNDDGAGISFIDYKHQQVSIIKPIWSLKETIEKVRSIEKKHGNPLMLLHLRLKTHGGRDKQNTHPFRLSKYAAVAHNGVFSGKQFVHKKKSDTRIYLDKYIRKFPADYLRHPGVLNLIEDQIGGYNKLAFIFYGEQPEIKIVNKDQGETIDNLWYSSPSATYDQTWYSPYYLDKSGVIQEYPSEKRRNLPARTKPSKTYPEEDCLNCGQGIPDDYYELFCHYCGANLYLQEMMES